MTKDQALKLALEALEKCRTYHQQEWSIEETTKPEVKQAIIAIKEALAQPEQERPVDCERCNRLEEQAYDLVGKLRVANIKLSMCPQRTWVGLTKEQLATTDWSADFRAGALWAEAKLKERNT